MSPRVLAAAVCLICLSAPAQKTPSQQTSAPQASPQTTASSPSAPLPDVRTLIDRVHARSIALENLRKKYICTVTQTADEFSANGSKKTHTDQYQAFYVENTEIFQHIARDGKPLSPADAKKEQQRVDKLVTKLKSHDQNSDKNNVQLSASGLLKMATFSNPRRQTINGRPTIVFDYKGNPGAKADTLGEEIMRRLAGTLWIDERDDAILRFSGALDQDFHVAGGLLINIKKGSWFDSTFEPVNGEIWFPAQTTAHIDGRFLLVKGIDGNLRDTFTDYRKLETSVTILPGTQVLEPSGQPPSTPPAPNQTAPPRGSPAPHL
ncbi:MAG TPA: hypothetical protein VMD97_04610 [Candidatus Aquilonibacter sp.]|nr:hypothetical protein [Candidatus Aquilonibacter sp.]